MSTFAIWVIALEFELTMVQHREKQRLLVFFPIFPEACSHTSGRVRQVLVLFLIYYPKTCVVFLNLYTIEVCTCYKLI